MREQMTKDHARKLSKVSDNMSIEDLELLDTIMESETSGPFSRERILAFLDILESEHLNKLVKPFLDVIESVIVDARREAQVQLHEATSAKDGPFD